MNVDEEYDDDDDDYESVPYITTDETTEFVYSLSASKDINAKMIVNKRPVVFQIDSGASINILPRKYLQNEEIQNTTKKLKMWNGSVLNPVGETTVKVKNEKTDKKYKVCFTIVNENLKPILGKRASEMMNLIKINYEMFEPVCALKTTDIKAEFDDVFNEDSVGKFRGTLKLCVDSDITPTEMPPRRVPVAIRDKLKEEIDSLVVKGVLCPVEEPTPWVNQMSVQQKKNGQMRICIDPRPLNKALKREIFQLPTLEEVLPDLVNSRVFSKLDVSKAYWHVIIDEESQKLTTMATPFGRYCWARLPFGLKISAEVFQRKLSQALEGLTGVICVADDIVIHAPNVETHDVYLRELLQRCRNVGIRLNKDKSMINIDEMIYMGHKISKNGIEPDPVKVQGIMNMPNPTDKSEILTLQGTVNYLAKFLPQLSDVMQPIRELAKDDVEFVWGKAQSDAFDKVKTLISSAPVLAYYDSTAELILQCDASNKGLGAALLQHGKPVAFVSRALTNTEQHYAAIEKEMLAVVWSLERFHQYTFGRTVTVHSDHRPLEAIVRKPLDRAPRRLQNMLMRAQAYDYNIVWKPGKEQYIADNLSRAVDPKAVAEKEGKFEDIASLNTYLPMRPEKIAELKHETDLDPQLSLLKSTIIEGWPDNKKDTSSLVMPFFSYADELSVQDGIIFKGERVVVPQSMRADTKKEIHAAHLGINGCVRRARETLFWPGMADDIKQFISKCETCRKYEISNQKEPLMPHEAPSLPWEKVGVDLFSVDGKNYMVTVDYYSNFWELDRLNNQDSTVIIKKLKSHFARFGIPSILVTDNAPNLTSDTMRNFTKSYNIHHVTSSPHHANANGMSESAVKTASRMIRKCNDSNSDLDMALLIHRNTPSEGMLTSPAQRLLGRRTRANLPITKDLLKPPVKQEKQSIERKQMKSAEYYDKQAKPLKALTEGQAVRLKPFALGQRVWKKGEVMKRLDERSYEILTENGNLVRRNRVHIKPTNEGSLTEIKDGTEKTDEIIKIKTPVKEPQKIAECVKSPNEGSREKEKPKERRPSTREPEKTPRKQPRDMQSATENKSKTKSPKSPVEETVTKSPVNTQNGTVKRSRYGRPIVKPKRFQMP